MTEYALAKTREYPSVYPSGCICITVLRKVLNLVIGILYMQKLKQIIENKACFNIIMIFNLPD